jgi:hypothetical protein
VKGTYEISTNNIKAASSILKLVQFISTLTAITTQKKYQMKLNFLSDKYHLLSFINQQQKLPYMCNKTQRENSL